MKHSLTAAVLIVALSATSAGVAFAQDSAGVGVGSGSALLSSDLRGGRNFQTTPVLNSHVQAALVYAKSFTHEVGFGFYTNKKLRLEYVPGEIRQGERVKDGVWGYRHNPEWQTEDAGLLAVRFGGEPGDWKWVGDAHVHEGVESTGGVQQHKGSPSLNDLEGELNPEYAHTHIMMVIASRKVLNGFDASIVFRKGELAARSPNHRQIFRNAKAEGEPQSHKQAIRILGDAYSGSNIAYFSGSFKGKRSKLKSGLFKYKGNP